MLPPDDPTHSVQPDPGEDEEASRCLVVLRDGDPDQQHAARATLARIFEGRGMLAEATELLETNARLGPEDADLHVRLASLYRRQGRPALAQEAIARAADITHPPPLDPPPAPSRDAARRLAPPVPAPAASARRHRLLVPFLVGGLAGFGAIAAFVVAWAGWYCGDCPDPAQPIRSAIPASGPVSVESTSSLAGVPTERSSITPPTSTLAAPTATREARATPAATATQAERSAAAPPGASPRPSPPVVATGPHPPAPSATPAPPPAVRAAPQGSNCPSDRPIKGNRGSRSTTEWIYHVPGGRSYAATTPEECFATEAEAQRAGYRRSLR